MTSNPTPYDHKGSGGAKRRAILHGGLVLLLAGCASQGALAPRGPDAEVADDLWVFMLWLGGVITVAWLALFLFGLLRRHREDADAADDDRIHRLFIVGGGIVLPALSLGALFVYNIAAFDDLPQGDDVVIEATGYQFWWEFTYADPAFVTANELHIPTDTDVQITLRAADVIHSFWVPQLAGKRDMIPGRVNQLTIRADEPGRYDGKCTEYCGIQHANMEFTVVAQTPEEYAEWAREMAEPAEEPETVAELAGYETFMTSSCIGCHAIAGTPAVSEIGPSLTHFARRQMLGAGVAPNDRGHLGGWVVNAQALKPGAEMPPADIEAADLDALLTYLESLE